MTIFCLMVLSSLPGQALNPDFYSSSSILSSGNWAKVRVGETGVNLITNSTLKALGFNDPSKVNVYGYGGRMIQEKLDTSTPDDLPLIPSLVTSEGIIFFGFANESWEQDSQYAYRHSINPYSDDSFYFISDYGDRHISPGNARIIDTKTDNEIDSFTERIFHENDLMAPATTGRLMLGEDFKNQDTRTFKFKLPGIISDAQMVARFGAKVTNGSSSLLFTANGNRLAATSSDKINGVNSSESFLALTTTRKTIKDCGEDLDLAIQFYHSGALFTAALDYIEIFYERDLSLKDNGLYFYMNPEVPSKVRLKGCDDSTLIWDVSDPFNPCRIDYSTAEGDASFTIDSGYHEFIAFNPLKISRFATAAGLIANQDLHGCEAPDMLIIAPDQYREAADRIASLHSRVDGMSVMTFSPEIIYNEFSSGTPDVTAFRRLLKMWYDRAAASGGTYPRYCLIMSRPSYDNKMVTTAVKNAGYPRIPVWQSPDGLTETTSYPCDDYIGMLDDYSPGWDISDATIQVAVGRMPVKSLSEALSAAEKLENYILSPNLGAWRNNVMIIADDQDNGTHLIQAEEVCGKLKDSGNGASLLYEKLYLDAYNLSYSSTGPVYNEARQRMFDKLSEGVMFLNYIGHASTKSWGHENLLTWTDITSLAYPNLPFVYAATCEFMRWDADDISGGEEMWLNPDSGVIGMICPTRTVYVSLNGILNSHTAEFMFRKNSDGKGTRTGDIMREGKNAMGHDSNKLRYSLMGDPAMRIPLPEYHVDSLKIDGNDLSDPDNLPVLPARSSFSLTGAITGDNGNEISDFNGIIHIQLYDSEKVVTTNGNGDNGVELSYNDRKTRLYIGKTNVENGRWKTVINLPSEIGNNFSPALLSFYAYDSSGREANGSTDRFYVYGYDPDSPEDTEGPQIHYLYLNNSSFKDGDAVGPSPTVVAAFSDSSGINVSDAGIGHEMSIRLDDNICLNDLTTYYSPDGNDPTAGEIEYPMNGIAPGEHTLSLTVWDNAGNSSSSSIRFKVKADWQPGITDLHTDINPASAAVNFIIASDAADEALSYMIEVFDISGRKVWQTETRPASGTETNIGWDLCDLAGARVARGIYPYRATMTTKSGQTVSESGKLAVTAR